jgi:hypothetical protein
MAGAAVEAGNLDDVPVTPLARLLIAMLTEAGPAIGRSDSPAETRDSISIVLDRLLTGLRPASHVQPIIFARIANRSNHFPIDRRCGIRQYQRQTSDHFWMIYLLDRH